MRTPLGLLGAALVFWGYRTGYLPLAAPLALCLELRFVVSWRISPKPADIHRLSDMGLLLMAGMGVYLFFSPPEQAPPLVLTQWLPVALFPLALGAAFSRTPKSNLAEIIYFLPMARGVLKRTRFDFCFVYFLACLIAAGCSELRTPLHFPLILILLCWSLFPLRSENHSRLLWIGLMIAAGLAGYAGQIVIHEVQMAARGWTKRYWADPYHASTALGEIGEIKLSREIYCRVRISGPGQGRPFLLREASYDMLMGNEWYSTNSSLIAINHDKTDSGSWTLIEGGVPKLSTTVYQFFHRRGGLLLLPPGTAQVRKLPTELLKLNDLGAVKAVNPPGLASYQALSDPNLSRVSPPRSLDLFIPPKEAETIKAAAAEFQIMDLEPAEAARRIKERFTTLFSYTLFQKSAAFSGAGGATPLARFLHETRAGHCEFFASAAVLLLRQANIPARYAVGYSVQEFNPETGLYQVRYTHRHAWALAWIGGRWIDLDPTPAVWLERERGPESFWSPLADLRARINFHLSSFRWLEEKARARRIMAWIGGLIGLALLIRLGRKGGLKLVRERKKSKPAQPDLDDRRFYFLRIEKKLAEQGWTRPRGLSLGEWFERLGKPELKDGLMLHYRMRFDPRADQVGLGKKIKRFVDEWLKKA